MGSIKRDHAGLVIVGLLLLAAAATVNGRVPLHHLKHAGVEPAQEVDLQTPSEADCAAYCQRHARDFPGKYKACMLTCQSGGQLEDEESEKKKKTPQEDMVLQLGSPECDECGNTSDLMEYISCLHSNNCD
jgi:hypothetical protein